MKSQYRNAPILILDEPTAALDAEAEMELFKDYKELVKNKLELLITHRFNTVRIADRIIVLEQGMVRIRIYCVCMGVMFRCTKPKPVVIETKPSFKQGKQVH